MVVITGVTVVTVVITVVMVVIGVASAEAIAATDAIDKNAKKHSQIRLTRRNYQSILNACLACGIHR